MNKTVLEIANLAIDHTGSGSRISAFEEDSTEARTCKNFIYITRDNHLKEYDWKFARRLDVPLKLLELKPHRDWGYSYLYPSDCLELRYVGDGTSLYIEAVDGNRRRVLYSNEPTLTVTYTTDSLPDSYPSDFALGWSYGLAITILPKVNQGNIKTLLPYLRDMYKMVMDKAVENNANTESPDYEQSDVMAAGGFYEIIP